MKPREYVATIVPCTVAEPAPAERTSIIVLTPSGVSGVSGSSGSVVPVLSPVPCATIRFLTSQVPAFVSVDVYLNAIL